MINIKSLNINKISEITTVVLFSLFVLSLPFSESFISISAGLILLVQLILSVFRKGVYSKLLKDLSLWLLISIFFIYLAGMMFSQDINLGLYELKKVMFWVILSFGVALSPKLSNKNFWFILFLFAFGVTVSTFFSFYKMLFSSILEIENFREVNYVSHIQFSFQISFSIIILIFSFLYDNEFSKKIRPFIRVIWIIWLLVFLVALKSILGIISFYITSIFLIWVILKNLKNERIKRLIKLIAIFIFIVPIIYIGHSIYRFYDIKYLEPEVQKTKLGNDYSFDFTNKFKENGYYISWYLCESELETSWNNRSLIKFRGVDKNGYQISETIKRYLTSKGLKKDAEGIASLTDRDVKNIESGIANYIYDSSVYSIYPRVYETIWELDHYFITNNPNDQSLSQRIEYGKAAIHIIKNNFWFGIGTGNFAKEYEKAFVDINSQLNKSHYGTAHNQYLNYFLKFGIFGLLYILFVVFFVISKKGQFQNRLLILFLVYFMIANLGDSNWETHVGLSFFVFFFSLFLWHSPPELRSKPDFKI